jgi:NAD(P)-dependent dehydrogenase (short-subunit alcohol dehydrogenase family)
MTNRLEGKVVLITGGSSGIGRATAIACAREGADVVISDVDETAGSDALKAVLGVASGCRAKFIRADISNAAEVELMINEVISFYGRLDCAHNNAGITGPAFLADEYPEEKWNQVIRINLTGVWLCMKHELKQMVIQKSGSIVNTSSAAGLRGLSYQCAYSASKHGIIGLSKTAAVEYAKKGIRVNAICPGFIDAGLTRQVVAKKPHLEEKYKSLIPMGRFGSVEDVAESVVWLFSDASSFVTGHALAIDGGASA